jgi:capsular exopolysaccharide synthesis family protein
MIGSLRAHEDRRTLGSFVPRALVPDPQLVVSRHPWSPLAERYRRVRLNLERGSNGHAASPHVTVITSAVPGEGKTTTAVNLALAFVEDRERRTLLIDADLRRPSVSRYIKPQPMLGLAEILSGEVTLDHALIEMSDSRLWVLPAGAPTATPLDLLQADELGRLIAELRGRFDRIIIDTPPTVPFTDAATLAAHADGTLLVVRAGATATRLIQRAKESLSGVTILGAVLNDVEFSVVDRYYYRYDDLEPRRYASTRNEELPIQTASR